MPDTAEVLASMNLLTQDDQATILALGLPLYDSLIVAYLRVAGELLSRDNILYPELKISAWQRWIASLDDAVQQMLATHENEELVITIGLASLLFPGAYPRATLTAYTTLTDAWERALSRRAARIERPRKRAGAALRRRLRRAAGWLNPVTGSIRLPGDGVSARKLKAEGYEEVSAIAVTHDEPAQIVPLISAILPVATHPLRDGMLFIALPNPG